MTRLMEAEVKDILAREGLAVPRGFVCSTPTEVGIAIDTLSGEAFVKAQVAAGDRAKLGGVLHATNRAEGEEGAETMLGSLIQGLVVETVLVEEAIVSRWEGYASVSIDEGPARQVVRFSKTGGSGFDPSSAPFALGIEAALQPHLVRRELKRVGVESSELQDLTAFLCRLAAISGRWATYTLEVNPICYTDNGVVVVDGKADVDDYSKALIPDSSFLDEEDRDWREREARQYQSSDHRGSLRYVQLIPDDVVKGPTMVASHSVGGGESMVVLDALAAANLSPTNYCDTSGSPSAAKVAKATELVSGQPHISGLLFSTCIANQPLSVTAQGLVDGWRSVGWSGPTVVRFAGNESEQARATVSEWAAETGALVAVLGEESDEWSAAERLGELLKGNVPHNEEVTR